jgi:hypothetical protein
MPSAITPIATYTTAASVNSVTFSSITSAYRDLMIVIRGSAVSASSVVGISSGGTNFFATRIYAWSSGSSAGNAADAGTHLHGQVVTTPTEFSQEVHIYDYAQTNKFKPYQMTQLDGTNAVTIASGYWAGTGAISSITISMYGGSPQIATGTQISLYGVSA